MDKGNLTKVGRAY